MIEAHATAPARIDAYCRALKLPGLRAAAADLAQLAERHQHPYPAFLAACLERELEVRRERRLALYLRLARLPAHKTLDTFDFSAVPQLSKPQVLALATGSFVRRRENVICVGPPGTGKTHVALALALGTLQAGLRVRFITAVTLAQELLLAQQEYRLPRYLNSWQPIDLVVLDEVGYLGLGPGGPLLFQFCAERYERGSLLLTTNLEFGRWTEVFGDVMLTAALLDRLTHHAHVLPFQGSSYRVRTRSLSMEEVPPDPSTAP
jgi:DNA replication protein DnaC